jgi:hypothetical protein
MVAFSSDHRTTNAMRTDNFAENGEDVTNIKATHTGPQHKCPHSPSPHNSHGLSPSVISVLFSCVRWDTTIAPAHYHHLPESNKHITRTK